MTEAEWAELVRLLAAARVEVSIDRRGRVSRRRSSPRGFL